MLGDSLRAPSASFGERTTRTCARCERSIAAARSMACLPGARTVRIPAPRPGPRRVQHLDPFNFLQPQPRINRNFADARLDLAAADCQLEFERGFDAAQRRPRVRPDVAELGQS